MKKIILKTFAFFLILTGLFSSCKDPELKINYPIDIPFTEYSLTNTSCRWINLPYDEQVIIINSNEELEEYLYCMLHYDYAIYPAIDFSKYTLLLACGVENNMFVPDYKSFQQISEKTYQLKVNLLSCEETVVTPWQVPILVNKIVDLTSAEIILTKEFPESIITSPIFVDDPKIIDFFENAFFQSYSLPKCFFTTVERYKDTILIINNMNEFSAAYICTDDLPKIDFNIYTLIIGKKAVGSSSIHFLDQKIVEGTLLTLNITYYDEENGSSAIGSKYHWGIYPKKPNKPFHVKYVFID